MYSPQHQVSPLDDWSIIPFYIDGDKILNFFGTWRLLEPSIWLNQAKFT